MERDYSLWHINFGYNHLYSPRLGVPKYKYPELRATFWVNPRINAKGYTTPDLLWDVPSNTWKYENPLVMRSWNRSKLVAARRVSSAWEAKLRSDWAQTREGLLALSQQYQTQMARSLSKLYYPMLIDVSVSENSISYHLSSVVKLRSADKPILTHRHLYRHYWPDEAGEQMRMLSLSPSEQVKDLQFMAGALEEISETGRLLMTNVNRLVRLSQPTHFFAEQEDWSAVENRRKGVVLLSGAMVAKP